MINMILRMHVNYENIFSVRYYIYNLTNDLGILLFLELVLLCTNIINKSNK